MSSVNKYCLIVTMITYILEEDATSQQRNLKSLYVNVGVVCVPGIGSNSIGYQCCKESIEVEQKKDSPFHVRVRHKVGQNATYRIPQTSNSTRKTLQMH